MPSSERKAKISNIKQNIHESIYDILYNMDKISPPVEFGSEDGRKAAEYVLNLGSQVPDDITDVNIFVKVYLLLLIRIPNEFRNISITLKPRGMIKASMNHSIDRTSTS